MKRRKSKSSWDYLPLELLTEVLARLPAKTLLKIRCVCKTWCSLIDSSHFAALHSKVQNNNINNCRNTQLQLLAGEKCKRAGYKIALRRSNTFKTIRNLGRIPIFHSFHSCNGLMLINKRDRKEARLWNPFIRKSLILPRWPLRLDDCSYLGFAPSTNDYKVLAVDYNRVFAVYSLNGNHWRVISYPVNDQDCGLSRVCATRVVSCGRAIYWVRYELFEAVKLFSFDFDAEKFSSVQLPDAVKQGAVWFIFRLGDSIAVFTMSSENSCIWVLNKNGGDDPWRLWFSGEPNSDVCNLLKPINSRLLFSGILYLQESNTFLIAYESFQLQNSGSRKTLRRLMSYNITSQEIQHLGKSIRGQISLDTYVESLVLHKGFEGRNLKSFP